MELDDTVKHQTDVGEFQLEGLASRRNAEARGR